MKEKECPGVIRLR